MTSVCLVITEAVFLKSREAQVQYLASLRGICSGWSSMRTDFSLGASVFLPVSFNWLSKLYFFIYHPCSMIFAFQTLCHLFIWMTYSLLYLYVHHPQCPALRYLPSLLAKNWTAWIFCLTVILQCTVLFEMIFEVLTTCHT